VDQQIIVKKSRKSQCSCEAAHRPNIWTQYSSYLPFKHQPPCADDREALCDSCRVPNAILNSLKLLFQTGVFQDPEPRPLELPWAPLKILAVFTDPACFGKWARG
jgi:hypothetical protein